MAKEEISWILADEPPITYVEKGDFTGYGVEILKLIQTQLPEYDHSLHLADNYQRAMQGVKNGPLTCALGVIKTPERMKFMSFSSAPALYFFNIQIVTRKSVFEFYGRPAKISLESLLQDRNLTLILSEGRKYTASLQKILDRYKNASHIRTTPNTKFSQTMLRMLHHKRFDYMFAYPEEFVYLSKYAENPEEMVTIPIAESQTFGASWAVCSKTAEGKKAITAINRALAILRPMPEYSSAYEKWLSPNLLPLYRENYQTEFLHISE